MKQEQQGKLLAQIESTASGLCGVAWLAQSRIGDSDFVSSQVKSMELQIENLQAAIAELKEARAE